MSQAHALDRHLMGGLGRVHETRNSAEGREALMSAPDRSLTQRMDALERANEIRTRRAAFKKELKRGQRDAVSAILDPPEWMLTMHLFDLLISVPKYGRVKVNRILTQCRISPSKTIGGLSERQRGEIISFLRRR